MKLLILLELFVIQNVLPQTFDYCSTSWDTAGRAVIDKNNMVSPGLVRAVAVYFCQAQQVELQLWQPIQGLEYRVVWKRAVQPPTELPGRSLVNLDTEDQIELSSETRIGLYAMSSGTIPVGTVFYADGSRKVNPAVTGRTNYQVGETYLFDDIQYPYEFYAQVCPEYDCQERVDPVLPQILPGLIPSEFLDCSDRLIETTGKSVIESERLLPTGRFRAIITYFCIQSPVTVQIWEPSQTDHYVLKWTRTLQPSRELGRRTVFPIEDSDSFSLSSNHRLGLTSSDPITPIPTMFIIDRADVIISELSGDFIKDTMYQFDSLDFPFEFRIAFCGTTDCSAELTDPTTTSTFPTSTLPDTTVTTTGTTTTQTTTYTTTTPSTTASTTAETTTSTSSTTTATTPSPTITTTQKTEPGPVGDTGPPGSKGTVGNTGVRGPPGNNGLKGESGSPGDTGNQGNRGLKGLAGDTGPNGHQGGIGDPGSPGLLGQSGAPFLAALKEDCACHTFQNKYLILGLIIWAVVLTLLIVIVTCIAAKDSLEMKNR